MEGKWHRFGGETRPKPIQEQIMPDTPLLEPSMLDRRFEAVVEEFLREREAGHNPDTQRYLERFPDVAPLLRDFFSGQALFDQVAPQLAPCVRATPAVTSDAKPHVGERVGGFELIEVLGRGGMGVVYRARQTKLDRIVALKMIRRGQAEDVELARFRIEAEAIARLQHPGIVQLYEVGEHDGMPFVALEYCGGGSLAERLRGATLLPADAATVVAALARAMQAAHRHNVIHRDLKPANILLQNLNHKDHEDHKEKIENGVGGLTASCSSCSLWFTSCIPKITDFGLARKLDDPGLTQSGAIVGTPSYMAPEQARGQSKAVGPAADIYALGAVLYECLTGRPPFRAATTLDTLAQVLDTDPVPPRQLNPAVPRDLETVCLKCLHKEPEKRYASAQALADDLGRYLDGRPVQARRVGRTERLLKWVRRRPAAAGLAAALLLLLVGGTVGGWLWEQQRLATREAAARRLGEADTAATLLLGEARLLRTQARANPLGDPDRLREARRTAQQAAELARANEASADVCRQAEELAAALTAEEEAAHRDRTLLAALLEVRGPHEGPRFEKDEQGRLLMLAEPSADEQFRDAFRAWGLDVDATPTAEAAARLGARPPGVVAEVLAALDQWANERGLPAARRRRLTLLAEKLDNSGGARRRELHEMLARNQLAREKGLSQLSAVLWSLGSHPVPVPFDTGWGEHRDRLRRLAAATDVKREPILDLLTLTRALVVAGHDHLAEDLLREALLSRPREVVLHHWLGQLMKKQERWREAAECYSAARVLRPELGVALANALTKSGRARQGRMLFELLLAQRRDNPWLHSQHGDALLLQRRYKEAEAAYREAFRLKRDYPRGHHKLGTALAGQNRDKEAEAELLEAVRIAPRDPGAHSALGFVLNRLEKYKEAEAAHRKALRLQPDLSESHDGLGMALSGQGRHKEAEVACREAIRLKPDDPDPHYNLGCALNRQGRYKEGEAANREAIRLDPDHAQAHVNLGIGLGEQGKHEEEEAAFRAAIRIDPNLFQAHACLAYFLSKREQYKEAEAEYLEALRIKPDSARAHVLFGSNVLSKQGRHKEAEREFRKAIQIKEDYPEARYCLAMALNDQGKYKEAEAACRKAIKIKHDYAEAHFSLGTLLSLQGKREEAEREFRAAIRIKPDFFEAHCRLGKLLFDHRPADAEAAYRAALRIKPDDVDARLLLIGTLNNQGKLKDLETACREALRIKPSFAPGHFFLGHALVRQRRFQEAENAYRKVIRLAPKYLKAHFFLGKALIFQNNNKEAEAAFRESLRIDGPGDHEAPFLLGLALHGQGRSREAEAAYREAIRLKKDYAEAHCNLGNLLGERDDLSGAEAAYLEALHHKPNLANAHSGLGLTLFNKGDFDGALAAYKRTLQIEPTHSVALANLPRAERYCALLARLPDILAGKAEPKTPMEGFEFAWLCARRYQKRYAAAVRLAEKALAADAKRANDVNAWRRYGAAWYAACAAAGAGIDSPSNPADRAALRNKAFAWLRADLALYAKMAQSDNQRSRVTVRERMEHWLRDTDLISVRDKAALERLPAGERAEWVQLWQDVEALRKRAAAPR
jgi:serine/threonine-protein kinase